MRQFEGARTVANFRGADGSGGAPGSEITLASLLARTSKADKGGHTPLLTAVEHGRTAICSALIDAKADVTLHPLNPDKILQLEVQTSKGSEPVTPLADRRNFKRFHSEKDLSGGTPISPVGSSGRRVSSDARRRKRYSFLDDAAVRNESADSSVPQGGWRIANHGAICLALSAGQMDVLLLLLERTRYPVIFSMRQLKSILLRTWVKQSGSSTGGSGMGPPTAWNARLFTALVLCAIPEGPVHVGEEDLSAQLRATAVERRRWAAATTVETDGVRLPRPQNPCLVALRLASACEAATSSYSRDRLRVARLREASRLLEFVASGLLHCADSDALNAESAKGFNVWKMGTRIIQPKVARDLYVTDCIEHAAMHDAKIFISQPLVYEHLQEVFWPVVPSGEGSGVVLASLGLTLFNVMALPLLPFLPRDWEKNLEQFFRDQQAASESALHLVWLLPSGRFALWFLATLWLAQFVTTLPPQPAHFEVWDVGLFAFLVGILKAEYGEAASDLASYGQLRRYLTDAFNVLDMLLVLLLGSLLITRQAHVADRTSVLAAYELPCQALLALVAWLRLLQVLFIFSTSGPLLLMAIRMLEDLWQFLMLASIVVIAFACAFYVLLAHEATAAAMAARTHAIEVGAAGVDGMAGSVAAAAATEAQSPMGDLSIKKVLALLVESTMKGEPDHIMVQSETASSFSWTIMFLFGIVVVLLLLNLLIARFAKTFDMVHENVDANFKVAFARIVVEGRKKELLPPPLNLLSELISTVYDFMQRRGTVYHSVCGCYHSCLRRVLRTAEVVTAPPGALMLEEEVDVEVGESDGERDGMRKGHSSAGGAHGTADDADADADPDEAWVAARVHEYLRKALEQQQDKNSPPKLVAFVMSFVSHRWYDIGREDQWRTDIQRQIGHVQRSMGEMMEDKFGVSARGGVQGS